MADEISRAGPTSGFSAKENVETLESQPYDKGANFAAARAMDPEHRARVEKSLKRKLDARCGLFIFLYISKQFSKLFLPDLAWPIGELPRYHVRSVESETIRPYYQGYSRMFW